MGTSNWQNIPFCVEALMKIAPQRVLDVGVGFGRWGIIVREFCDVWYGRVLQKDWQVHLEGIEGFADNIAPYHTQFYNQIHIGDANELLPPLLKSGWDVVIFGDVLEHFTKTDGYRLLNESLACSTYILVNIPLGDSWPQEDIYNNPYERHLSVWWAEDFEQFYLRRVALFEDFLGRPFGSFILSRTDPQNLHLTLFSKNTDLSHPEANITANYLTPAQRHLLAEAARNAQELARIKSTLTWQTYEALDRSPLGPYLRRFMKIVGAPIRRRLSQRRQHVLTDSGKSIPPTTLPVQSDQGGTLPTLVRPTVFSSEETDWLKQVTPAETVAVLHPDWRGIRQATVNLFTTCRFVDDTLDPRQAEHIARLLAETGCKRVVFSGFPLSHHYLVRALRRITPQIRLLVLWHGNFLQTGEDYAWQGFQLLKELAQQGLIDKWGFVKKGMAEIVATLGIRTGFVMNYINEIPAGPSKPLDGGPHLGVWGVEYNWRKPPYAMLAATRLIPGARIHSSAVQNRTQEFGQVMNINWAYTSYDLLDPQLMLRLLAQMHLNLYVTLSECAPMLPLESLSVGTPCLIGPNSHLFEDDELLRQMLVVPYPDSAPSIAEYATRALENREEIIQRYIEYAPAYNERAKASLTQFLEE